MKQQHSISSKLAERFHLVSTAVSLGARTFVVQHPRDVDELLDEAAFNRDGRIPYWAQIWPAARVLAEKLLAQQDDGLNLLDLGCGVGLTSLAAVASGYRVLATDYYDDALEFVQLNALANELQPPMTRLLDWRDWPADLGRFDRVVAADVLYEPPMTELIVQVLARSLAPDGEAWVTDPQRRHAAELAERCQAHSLRVVERATTPCVWGTTTTLVDTYTIRTA